MEEWNKNRAGEEEGGEGGVSGPGGKNTSGEKPPNLPVLVLMRTEGLTLY